MIRKSLIALLEHSLESREFFPITITFSEPSALSLILLGAVLGVAMYLGVTFMLAGIVSLPSKFLRREM